MNGSPQEKKQIRIKQDIFTPDSSPIGANVLVDEKINDEWEMNTLKTLCFAEFLEQNPVSVNLQLINPSEHMLFVDVIFFLYLSSDKEKEFMVNIEILDFAHLQVTRTFDEFAAFYQAVKDFFPLFSEKLVVGDKNASS